MARSATEMQSWTRILATREGSGRGTNGRLGQDARFSMTDSSRASAVPSPSIEPTSLRVVMFGTPDFAVPALERLATDRRFEVVLVVTQPDRPAGRGRHLEASPHLDSCSGRKR